MDFLQLRCFLAAADKLHFGRAAQSLDMLPASFGRQIRLLEDQLGTRLFERTTRRVTLSPAGAEILEDARAVLSRAAALEDKLRRMRAAATPPLRVGAIDSAAAGLVPHLIMALRANAPDLRLHLSEQKTVQLLPRLLSGALDIAFCRPPQTSDPRLHIRWLYDETPILALPQGHPLAGQARLTPGDLADAPLIVPDRRTRPHSHDLTIRLFTDAGLTPRIAQIAEEKQTIVNLVAAGTGLAILPEWSARFRVPGVVFRPLPDGAGAYRLSLAAIWPRGAPDPARDQLLAQLAPVLRDLGRI